MRNTEQGTNGKQNSSRPIRKRRRRCARHAAYFRNRRRRSVGMENLECINEALRHHKGFGGSWRLVPKDSLEVYKYQRDRDVNNNYKRPTNGQHKRTPIRDKRGDKKCISPSTSGESCTEEEESRCSKDKAARTPKRAEKAPPKGGKKKNLNPKKDPKKPGSDESVSSQGSFTETSMSDCSASRPSSTDMEE